MTKQVDRMDELLAFERLAYEQLANNNPSAFASYRLLAIAIKELGEGAVDDGVSDRDTNTLALELMRRYKREHPPETSAPWRALAKAKGLR